MRESMAGPSAIPRGCDAFNRKLALVVGQVTDFCVVHDQFQCFAAGAHRCRDSAARR